MVTWNEDNNNQDLNNQGCLAILSWLTFNGFKCSEKQTAPRSQRVLLQEYLTNYEVPENPKQIYNGIDCLIMKVIKTHKYNFH